MPENNNENSNNNKLNIYNINHKNQQPAMYQIWLTAEDNAEDNTLSTTILKQNFHYNTKLINEAAEKLKKTNKILCGSYTKDVAETKINEINAKISSQTQTMKFVLKKGLAHVIKKS